MLTQRRFLFDGDDDGTRWAIPVIVRQRHGDLTKEDRLLLDGDEALVGAAATRTRVVVVNAGSHGFYRVAYDADLLGRLTGPALAELSTPERYSLVDDAWAAVVAGALDGRRLRPLRRGLRRRARPAGLADAAQRAAAGAIGSSTATTASASRPSSARLVAPALDDLGWAAGRRRGRPHRASCGAR